MALSDYEKKRLENIKRNQDLLRSLEVPDAGYVSPELNKAKKIKTEGSSNIKKHIPKKRSTAPSKPVRTSSRIRGIAADSIELDDNEALLKRADSRKRDESKEYEPERINTLNDKDQANFMEILGKAAKDQEDDIEPKLDPALEPLKDQLENLRIRHSWATVKMTPDKISSCLFHPNKTKLLVVAASASGRLSFWDVDNKDEADDPVVFSYRPNTKGITHAKFCMNDPSTLYTSSYDGTLQTFDMNSTKFGNISLDDKYMISSFDINQDGKVIYFSTVDGDLGIRDLRSDKAETIMNIRTKKIGCIHLNPVHTNLLVAASNDRTATIWDIRHLQPEKSPLQEITHGFANTSAYWSPTGKQLATTSYDDYLRVFDLKDNQSEVTLKGKISHNCHTGKWVTMFRTVWNENKRFGIDHPHFVVGNMRHPASIFSGESVSKIIDLYDEERITAIPAVNEFHPTLDSLALVSANGSGRVVCWT